MVINTASSIATLVDIIILWPNNAIMQKPSLIFFAGIEWSGQNTMPCHHLVKQLAKEYQVFYIDNFGALRDLTFHDISRCVGKLGRYDGANTQKPRRVDGVKVWQPWVIPTPRTKLLRAFNAKLLKKSLNMLCEKYEITKPIVWTRVATDLVWEALDGFERSALIYQSVDKFPEHPRISKSLRARYYCSERKFNESADVVFASARSLAKEKEVVNCNTHFLPNGVAQSFPDEVDHAAEFLLSLNGPIVGFTGALGTATDIELLIAVARGLPNVHFVFLGTVDRTVSIWELEGLENVHIIGLIDHADLPRWLVGFDVGLMPYRINLFQNYTFPSKLAEYLSFDLPIVATPLPELMPYADVVSTSSDAAEMIVAIKGAICSVANADSSLTRRRAEIVGSLTWESIGQKAIGEIDKFLNYND